MGMRKFRFQLCSSLAVHSQMNYVTSLDFSFLIHKTLGLGDF